MRSRRISLHRMNQLHHIFDPRGDVHGFFMLLTGLREKPGVVFQKGGTAGAIRDNKIKLIGNQNRQILNSKFLGGLQIAVGPGGQAATAILKHIDFLGDFFQKLQCRTAGILADNVDAAAHKITDAQGFSPALMNSGIDLIPEGAGGKAFDNLMGVHKITAEDLQ